MSRRIDRPRRCPHRRAWLWLPFRRRHPVGEFIVEERLRAEPDVVVGDELRRRFVHQVAVLDAANAAADRGADGARRVGVHGDISAPVLRRLDRGAELGLGILADVDRIVVRRHAAPGGKLELACAKHQLLAGALQHAIGAVGDGPGADGLDVAQRRIGHRRKSRREAENRHGRWSAKSSRRRARCAGQ